MEACDGYDRVIQLIVDSTHFSSSDDSVSSPDQMIIAVNKYNDNRYVMSAWRRD